METKIKIKHQTGSKAGQIEEFAATGGELLIGRGNKCRIQYDPDIDDVVSREHAILSADAAEADTYWIEDRNSSNGLYVNGKQVWGKVKIYAGDTVEVGAKGPTFIFDLDPRPESHIKKTQVINIAPIKPTSVNEAVAAAAAEEEPQATPQPVGKQGVGKETVQRIVLEERRKNKTSTLLMVASICLLVVAGGIFLYKKNVAVGEDAQGRIGLIGSEIERLKDTVGKVIDDKTSPTAKTPTQIAAENSDKVVFIEMAWKLIYTRTGEDLGQLLLPVVIDGVKRLAGAFMQTAQGIEPVLITRSMDPNANIEPIRGLGSGTGFVIAPDGFIITARHVASNWFVGYSFPPSTFPGVLINSERKIIAKSVITEDMVSNWIPANAQNINYEVAGKLVEGTNTYLDVTFARNDLRMPAKVARISNKHDVAMIKVDIPQVLEAVTMHDNYSEIRTGDVVTVMGYPGASPGQLSQIASNDYFNRNPQLVTVPVPTLSQGNIGRLIKGNTQTTSGNYFSIFGDSYQLTINSTGPGNSGGPLFDDQGRVTGIFNAGNGVISYAVPIRYALELMGTSAVIDSK